MEYTKELIELISKKVLEKINGKQQESSTTLPEIEKSMELEKELAELVSNEILKKMNDKLQESLIILARIEKKMGLERKLSSETEKKLKDIVKSKNGEILNISYNFMFMSNTAAYRVRLKCNMDNNVWETSVGNIITNNTWCPKCGKNKPLSIEVAKNIAKEHDGECLSDEYKNAATPLLWKCKNPLHSSWYATLNHVKNGGTWCPMCRNYNVNEEYCRVCFTILLPGHSFENTNPSFLINPSSGFPMQLDGFCETLKLAFEYNGEQHYRDINIFSKKSSEMIKERDKIKYDICTEQKINLVVIPYTVNKKDILKFIYDKLKEIALCDEKIKDILPNIMPNMSVLEIDQKASEIKTLEDEKKYEKMITAVKSKGGILHTDKYVSANTCFKVTCGNINNPHTFTTTYRAIVLTNHWCKECDLIKKSTSVDEILNECKGKINVIQIYRQQNNVKSIIYENNKAVERKGNEPRGVLRIVAQCFMNHPIRDTEWYGLKLTLLNDWRGCRNCKKVLDELKKNKQ